MVGLDGRLCVVMAGAMPVMAASGSCGGTEREW